MSEELDGMAAYVNAINNPSLDDPNWPLPSFDAKDWAEAFCKQFPGHDEGVMLSWFANALMRGYDEHALRAADTARAVQDEEVVSVLQHGHIEIAEAHIVCDALRAAGLKVVRDV